MTQRRAGTELRSPHRRRRLNVVVPIAATLAALGYLVTAIAVWHVPHSDAGTRREPYRLSLAVDYSGHAPAGAAYPRGKVVTGDLIFTRLVKRVDIGIAYEFQSEARADVSGTYDVIASVSNAGAWSRSLVLAPATRFSGDHVRATATLPIARLRSFLARFSAETGVDTTQVTVSVAPHVHVDGVFDRTPFSAEATSKLDFQLGPFEMIPTAPTRAHAPVPAATTAGSVTIATARTGALSIGKLRVPVTLARLALLVACALTLAAFAVVMSIDRRRRAMGEAGAIIRRYGPLLIETHSVPPTDARAMVRVDSMRGLARLAHLHEQLIIHAYAPGVHRFVLPTETVVYYYDTERIPGCAGPLTLAA